jgi:hypothetical protein
VPLGGGGGTCEGMGAARLIVHSCAAAAAVADAAAAVAVNGVWSATAGRGAAAAPVVVWNLASCLSHPAAVPLIQLS